MGNVPVDFLSTGRVDDKAVRALVALPHLAGDVITGAEFVAETVTLIVDEETTNTTESLSSQELDLGVGVLGMNETSGMDLDEVEVDYETKVKQIGC